MRLKRFFFTIVLPFLGFTFLVVNVLNKNIQDFDTYVYSIISKVASERMTSLMIFISFLASEQFLGMICVLIFLSMFSRKQKYTFYSAMLIINIALCALTNVGLKWLISRNRPDVLQLVQVTGLSFPSGHSMAAMSFYGFLIYLCSRFFKGKYKSLIISIPVVLISLIGFSRIYLGVHYASDVLGGLFFGLFWVGVFTVVLERMQGKYA